MRDGGSCPPPLRHREGVAAEARATEPLPVHLGGGHARLGV